MKMTKIVFISLYINIIATVAWANTPTTFKDHTESVECVVYSPDSNTLASGSWDQTIKLWDTKTGELKHTLTSHTDSVRNLAYSPDGKFLASASDDNTIKLWNAKTGELINTLTSHSDFVKNLAYSPDSKFLASASDDKTIKLWDVKTGTLKNTLTGHLDYVNAVAYSPDGKTLVSASDDSTIKLWDAKTGTLKNTLTGHTRSINVIAYSPDGKILASASSDKTIKLWDTKTGELKHSFTGQNVNALAYSPTENILATINEDTIKLWNTNTNQQIANLQHPNSINAIAYSPNGQTIVFASGNEIQVWHVGAHKLEKRLFAQLTNLPEKIQEIEAQISDKLKQVKKELKGVDSELKRVLPQKIELTRWFEKLNKLEKAANLTALKNLETPELVGFDKEIKKLLSQRQKRAVGILGLKIQIINTELPKLENLRTHTANLPVLDRINILEKIKVLETELSSQLSTLDAHLKVIKTEVHRFVGKSASTVLSVTSKGNGSAPDFPHSGNRNQQTSIPMVHKTLSLPDNSGLFVRRNNDFGKVQIISIEKLINQGILPGQNDIRYDDFLTQETEDIPSPQPDNALAVSYGIATIPAYQKRANSSATHYLEIALKTAKSAPSTTPKNQVSPAVNYIFVVDTSESMAGEKLDTVKTSIGELFSRMRAGDVLGIIKFSNQVETILKATPINHISPKKFSKIISRMTASGGTDINLGLSFGINQIDRYSSPQKINQIFLFSDGNPTSGEKNWLKIQQNIATKTRGNIRISTFTFGDGASRREIDKLAGITGGKSTFVKELKDVQFSLQKELNRHIAAKNVQLQIEIAPDIAIQHFYGHDLITDPVARAAVEREADLAGKKVEENYDVKPKPSLIKGDKGIRVFVPNLAVGETYWLVLELKVPNKSSTSTSNIGKATVQYFDTFARQNETHQFDELSLKVQGQIAPQIVAQHALGLWTSEVVDYALDDLYETDLNTAEKRIRVHISILESAASESLKGDIITLRNFLTLTQNLGTVVNVSDNPQESLANLVSGLNIFSRVRNGYVRNQ